jgi:hypothetical protein
MHKIGAVGRISVILCKMFIQFNYLDDNKSCFICVFYCLVGH